MRSLLAKFVFPILVVLFVGLILFSYFRVTKERTQLIDDLDRRARVIARSLSVGAIRAIRNPPTPDEEDLAERLSGQGRTMGIMVCGPDGKLVARSAALVDLKTCEAPEIQEVIVSQKENVLTHDEKGMTLHTLLFPLKTRSGEFSGVLVIVHEAGHFLIARWTLWSQQPLSLVGPPGLREYVETLLRLLAWDIKIRHFEERLSEEARRVEVREVAAGETVEGDHWRATAIAVDHFPVEHAYAWRFDAEGASLVISGDTAPYEPLARAAAGVDMLVHETWLPPKEELARRYMTPEKAEAFIAMRNRYHTGSRDVGRIARLADPKLLLLSHLGPVNTDQVRADVAKDFARFVVGEDLLRYDVGRVRPA